LITRRCDGTTSRKTRRWLKRNKNNAWSLYSL